MEEASNLGNQIYLYVSIGLIVAFIAIDKAFILISKRKNNGNPYKNHYPIIMENKARILLNKQAIDSICKIMDGIREENREDHQLIFNKLDKLWEKVK